MIKKPTKIDRHINVSDTIRLTDSLYIKKTSQDGKDIGLAFVDDEREISAERTATESKEKLLFKQNGQKQLQEEQEIQTIQRLLPLYNSTYMTDYKDPSKNTEQSSPIDVYCESESSSFPKLNFQITVSEHEAFSKYGARKSFERSGSGNTVFHQYWKQRIQEKASKYPEADKKNLILVLDGWPVAYRDDLEQFKEKEKQFLEGSGFKEIWFVGLIDDTIIQFY